MSDIQEQIKIAHKRAKENDIKLLQEEIDDYKLRIDKAIEYIKAGKTFDNEDVRKVVNKIQNDLLDILKGDNK